VTEFSGYSALGIPEELPGPLAITLSDALASVWRTQLGTMSSGKSTQALLRIHSRDVDSLRADLEIMKYWFDPVASGKRLREVLASLPPLSDTSNLQPPAALKVDKDRWLLTPEGRVLLWVLSRSSPEIFDATPVYVSSSVVQTGLAVLADVYRTWTRQRIDGVTALLTGETATLRPTAAGLLLVLLVNRNTAPDRRLPAPGTPLASDEMSMAIAAPAIAFARELAGSDRASERGIDLYRGWAMGEIARRLGEGLHQGSDGVWIVPEYEQVARQRLIESLAERPPKIRSRVPSALDAALREYERVRPALSGLGLAYERPSNTRQLQFDLGAVADIDGDEIP
jgi:hypothetical protein